MMTTADIAKIIHNHCRSLPIDDIQHEGLFAEGELTAERVSILPKEMSYGATWARCYVEVNISVPDLDAERADLRRLAELERIYVGAFGHVTGRYNDVPYRFRRESFGKHQDAQMRCHYINIRILFEHLNTNEQWQQSPQ